MNFKRYIVFDYVNVTLVKVFQQSRMIITHRHLEF